MAGVDPRRIGLSATIGDPEHVGSFLASGTGRGCIIPRFEEPRRTWRLSMEHFYITGPQATERARDEFSQGGAAGPLRADGTIAADVVAVERVDRAGHGGTDDAVTIPRVDERALLAPTDRAPADADPGIGYIFERTRGAKCLVFVNSREEAEAVCTMLRAYCEANREPDRFLIPWLGSYGFLALERLIKIKCAKELGISGVDASRPYFLQFKMKADAETFFRVLADEADALEDPIELVYPSEVPYFDKYDELLPAELVRKGFAEGVLDVEGMRRCVREWGWHLHPTAFSASGDDSVM